MSSMRRNGGGGLASMEGYRAPKDRQLAYLLSQRGEGPSALPLSDLVSDDVDTDHHGNGASMMDLVKLPLQIKSLLQPQQSSEGLARGLRLAHRLVLRTSWHRIVHHCTDWINASLSQFNKARRESVELLDLLLGPQVRKYAEYWRNVGAAASTKYGMVLLEAAETLTTASSSTVGDDQELTVVLEALARQVAQHPATFRAHAPRIHKLCIDLLFHQSTRPTLASPSSLGRCVESATRLLARLPATGKGRQGQEELWSATLAMLIREVQVVWSHCSDTMVAPSPGLPTTSSVFREADDASLDPVEAPPLHHARLALLCGSAPRAGILPLFLSEVTVGYVRIPASQVLDLAHTILALDPQAPSQRSDPPEASLHAAQTALLPHAHLCAMTLLATLPATLWQRGHAQSILRLLEVAERSSAALRCVALHTLQQGHFRFNPHGTLVNRCTRLCFAQLARLVTQPAPSSTKNDAANTAATASSNTTNGRANKKRRTYEADQVFLQPPQGLLDLDADEQAACLAAAQLLTQKLFPHLLTFVSPQAHDLAQASCTLLLGIVELALQQDAQIGETGVPLVAGLVDALAMLLRQCRGALLGLLTVRGGSLSAQALRHPDATVQQAGQRLCLALTDTFHPKVPPTIALRLHVDQDVVEGDQEDRKLDAVVIDEDRGRSEREVLAEVVGILPPSVGNADSTLGATLAVGEGQSNALPPFSRAPPSSTLAPPSATTVSPTHPSNGHGLAAPTPFSPDPVKPIRRPSTPRIGSPISTSARRSLGGAADGAGSSSPERNASHWPALSTTPSRVEQLPPPQPSKKVDSDEMMATTDVRHPAASSSATQPTAQAPTSPLTRPSTQPSSRPSGFEVDDDEDSDGSMPELDMRSSDEEDE